MNEVISFLLLLLQITRFFMYYTDRLLDAVHCYSETFTAEEVGESQRAAGD